MILLDIIVTLYPFILIEMSKLFEVYEFNMALKVLIFLLVFIPIFIFGYKRFEYIEKKIDRLKEVRKEKLKTDFNFVRLAFFLEPFVLIGLKKIYEILNISEKVKLPILILLVVFAVIYVNGKFFKLEKELR